MFAQMYLDPVSGVKVHLPNPPFYKTGLSCHADLGSPPSENLIWAVHMRKSVGRSRHGEVLY